MSSQLENSEIYKYIRDTNIEKIKEWINKCLRDNNRKAIMYAKKLNINKKKGWNDIIVIICSYLIPTELDKSLEYYGPPLFYASSLNKLKIVKILLESNADVNIKNNLNRTPLIWSTICGNNDMVELLINSKANKKIEDNNYFTALLYAIKYNHNNIIKLLEE
tara:strand:- start:72 stop:560 length:489 start_codon:yes stop_codon:yes gene_type:complete